MRTIPPLAAQANKAGVFFLEAESMNQKLSYKEAVTDLEMKYRELLENGGGISIMLCVGANGNMLEPDRTIAIGEDYCDKSGTQTMESHNAMMSGLLTMLLNETGSLIAYGCPDRDGAEVRKEFFEYLAPWIMKTMPGIMVSVSVGCSREEASEILGHMAGKGPVQ